MKATTSSALNVLPQPGNSPLRSWLSNIAPSALPTVNNDASPVLDEEEIYGPAPLPHSRSIKFDEPTSSLHAPKNTLRRDPTSPKSPGLFGSPRISLRSPGLFGSPASSFAHSFSSASSTSSIASFFKKGKAKLTSLDSFRRLADLVTDKILPPRNSTRHPRSADSESELVPIASSSHPTTAGPRPPSLEPVTRQPLVSRQPPSASPVVKRSLSQTDIVEKPPMNVVLKKLKFTKTKRSNISPALP
ncbi:hypothetical protein ONZ45_g19568 [Pleurotus djamor]|nr:hypothetical protein ONZ45_g19568 [Pleurotus djamor]